MSEEYAKVECPHCDAMISSKPGPYANHVKSCKVEKEKAMKKAAAEFNASSKDDIANVKDADIRRTMEKAIAIQKSMLEAPDLGTVELSTDINMQLRKRYAPETIERFDSDGRPLNTHTHTAFFGAAKDMHVDVSRGYVPKLNENGEYVVNKGGDIMYTIRKEITEKRVREAQTESRARIMDVTRTAQTQETAAGISAPGLADGVIKQEQLARVGTISSSDVDL